MPYDEKQLAGYVLLIDKQGTAQDDVAAPPEGQTLLYTTEQGLVLERAPSEGFAARQWFLDQPYLLGGNESVLLTGGNPASVLADPYIVPDDIDSALPTIYRLELQVYVEAFSPDTSSIGIMVQPYVNGATSLPPSLVPCDVASGFGGTFVTFFVTSEVAGLEIDVKAYTIDSADTATVFVPYGAIKRVLRLSGIGG